MEIALASTTSPRVPVRSTVLVPVGSTEQHGPHLPLSTDTEIARAVAVTAAKKVRRRRLSVTVAPAVAYGSSGMHQDFAGTVSIGTAVLRSVLVEVGRSACTWADRVVFVNGHAGNAEALLQAVAELSAQGHDVSSVTCASEDSELHAGRGDTSLMLLLRPRAVRFGRADVGGAPHGATKVEGRRILDRMARIVAAEVLRGSQDPVIV